jgi:signal transduction histidine kinase
MNANGFMPHGYCFEWRPGVLWLHVSSDIGIAAAYFGISFTLFYIVKKRREVPFQPLFLLFGAFIILCGTTHLMAVWVLWYPNYYIEGYIKAATAIVSLITFVTLIFVLPRLLQTTLSLETLLADRGKELASANAELRAQIAARESVESSLRQAQKMEAIGQLTGGISHDFNNMLQAISGSMEMAQHYLADGQAAETARHLQSVGQIVDRAGALTSRLLAFARRQPLQPRAVLLDELIMGMEDLLHRTLSAPAANVNFDLRLNAAGWAVLCDPNQLENALLNVTINARDAMPDGGGFVISTRQVTLTAAELAGHEGTYPGEYVELTVADTGIGMDDATRSRAFEPFFTTKPTGQGTGLGLSQVYGFARQSGGLVMLESRQNSGTAVRIYLRRCATAAIPGPVRRDAAPAQPGNARLLLVEDEAVVRDNAAEFLRRRGYQVLEAGDSAAALEIFRAASPFDMLITDIGLPNGMNGRQLAGAIRETAIDLPILFITGYAGSAGIDELDSGMKILTKPFTLQALTAEVETMLAPGTPRTK